VITTHLLRYAACAVLNYTFTLHRHPANPFISRVFHTTKFKKSEKTDFFSLFLKKMSKNTSNHGVFVRIWKKLCYVDIRTFSL